MSRLPANASLAALILFGACVSTARAHNYEQETLERSIATMKALGATPAQCIPASLMKQAAAVVIIPHAVKAGLLIDQEHGRGVLFVRQPDGRWSSPVFVHLSGHGFGLQVGVEASEHVLVFKTRQSLDRALAGKLILGRDAAVAAGPVGRDVEVATDRRLLRSEIFSYARSRGLFAGLSLEGSTLQVDNAGNEAFYRVRGCQPVDVLKRRGNEVPMVESLRGELVHLCGAPVGAPVPVTPAVVIPAGYPRRP